MRLALALLIAVCLQALLLPRAVAQDNKFDVFGGYSFVHASDPVTATFTCPAGTCPITTSTFHPNLNGWEAAGTFKFTSWLGGTADFSGHYGSVGSSSAHLQTYLFGPTVSLPRDVSPFVHVLFGDAHESNGSGVQGPESVIIPTSRSAFATAIGAGIDIKVLPFASIRLIQIDYLLTRFNSSTQNQPRVSAGVLFHF